ncbi:MAG: hypothetical protein LUO79_01855 [Methanomassiliicoccales archaeon]|nr:hypothetical protein [Methanomassiliicoccales archaeon]
MSNDLTGGTVGAQAPRRREAQTVYERDLDALLERLVASSASPEVRGKVEGLADRLKQLRDRNMLKINHSVLELVVAKSLTAEGYDVDLEHTLESGLTSDVFARKGFGTLIVEVETGYVPPSHALDPVDYIKARIASKIARYSGFCNKFVLAAPPHYVMPVPQALIKPSRYRTEEELSMVKRYCDMYYSNPPVSRHEILNAHIHSVQIIDVEGLSIREVEPGDYAKRAESWYS